MGTTEKPELRILVSFDDARGFDNQLLVAKAVIVRIEDGKVRNPSEDTWRNEAAFAADLELAAQASRAESLEDSGFYGWSYEYRSPYSINLERAELMVKTLRKVKTGLERLEAKYGAPASFGQYVARVGSILGVASYGWHTHLGHTYDDSIVHWTDASGIDYHITHRLREFHKPATEGAAV